MQKTRIISAIMACAIIATPTMGIASSNTSKSWSHQLTAYAYAQNVKGNWIKDSNGKWWYRHDDGSYTKNDWEMINYKWYLFDSNGYMRTGLARFKGDLFYLDPKNGNMLTDWRKVNGYWYYFDNTSGKAWTGWHYINGYNYYFANDTCRAYEGIHTIDGKGYYFVESKSDEKNACKMRCGTWFSLYEPAKDLNGKARRYYAFPDGHLAKGITYIDGVRHKFHETMYYMLW